MLDRRVEVPVHLEAVGGPPERRGDPQIVCLIHPFSLATRILRSQWPLVSCADDLGGERLQRLPVVRALAERDAEPRAAERAELARPWPRASFTVPRR